MGSKRPHDDDVVDAGGSTHAPDAKKPRKGKGFRVGPDNLPDGAWRRKNTKIKHELIHKAKVKKEYAKVKSEVEKEKEKEKEEEERQVDNTGDDGDGAAAAGGADQPQQAVDNVQDREHMNPERQALLNGEMIPRKPRAVVVAAEAAEAADATAGTGQRQQRSEAEGEGAAGNTDGREGEEVAADAGQAGRERRRNTNRRPDYYDKALKEGSKKKAEAEARAAEHRRRGEERERRVAERERVRRAMLKAKGATTHGRNAGKQKLGRESFVLLDKVKRMVGNRA